MANEKRLIDAWDLIEWLDDFDRENTLRVLRCKKAKLLNSHAIRNMIDDAPTVDAVEVVRCEKCEYYDEEGEFCNFWHGVRHPEHYCGEGERRTDE